MKFTKIAVATIAAMAMSVSVASADITAKAQELAKSSIAKWASDSKVIAAIKAQNGQNASWDVNVLDKKWRAEVGAGGGPMIEKTLANDLSAYLKAVQGDAGGQFTEIFVMDNKGLNVGQTDVTSDYWQGDEAKFQKTYGVGDGAIHVSDVELDESTQTYQLQVSMTISDGGSPIGAVTVGVDAASLE
jgi:hypothetical protein